MVRAYAGGQGAAQHSSYFSHVGLEGPSTQAVCLPKGKCVVNGIAIAMFVALFTFGRDYFRWGGNEVETQIAIFAAFLFGVLATWKSR